MASGGPVKIKGKQRRTHRPSSPLPFISNLISTITHLLFPKKTSAATKKIPLSTFKTKEAVTEEGAAIEEIRRTRETLKQFRNRNYQYTPSILMLIHKRCQTWKKHPANIKNLNERIAFEKQFRLFVAENLGAVKAYSKTHSDVFFFKTLQTKLKQLKSTINPDEKLRLAKHLHQFLAKHLEAIKRYNRKQGDVPEDVDLILHIAFLMKADTDPRILSNDERKVSTRLLDFAETHYDYFRTLLDEDRLSLAMTKLLMQVEARWRAKVYRPAVYALSDDERGQLSSLKQLLAIGASKNEAKEDRAFAYATIKMLLNDTGLSTIANLAANDANLYAFCKTGDLKDHWETRLTSQEIFKSPSNFRLLPQESRHPFDQLMDRHGMQYKINQPKYDQRFNKYNAPNLFKIFVRDQQYGTRYREKLAPYDCFNDRTSHKSLAALALHGAIYYLAITHKISHEIDYLHQRKQHNTTALLKINYNIAWSALKLLRSTLNISKNTFHNATEGKHFSWLKFKLGDQAINTFGGAAAFFRHAEELDGITSGNRITFDY